MHSGLPRTHAVALQDGVGSGAELTQLTVGATTTDSVAQRTIHGHGAPFGENNSRTVPLT